MKRRKTPQSNSVFPKDVWIHCIFPHCDFASIAKLGQTSQQFYKWIRPVREKIQPVLQCEGDSYDRVVAAVKTGDLGLVKYCMYPRMYSIDLWKVTTLAIQNNAVDIIDYFITLGFTSWNFAANVAAEYGHMTLLTRFIALGEQWNTRQWSSITVSAARGGHMKIVEYVINETIGIDDMIMWHHVLRGAVEGHHWNLVHFAISNGARGWRMAIQRATLYKHEDMIVFFINKINETT